MNLLLYLARSKIGAAALGWVFEYMSFIIPGKRLVETESLLAFRHPAPAWEVHILIVPKKTIRGLEDLEAADSAILGEVFQTARKLVVDLDLRDYRIIANGGGYQEVGQLHFHLVSGDRI